MSEKNIELLLLQLDIWDMDELKDSFSQKMTEVIHDSQK